MSGDAGGSSDLLFVEQFDNCLTLVGRGASVQAALSYFPETARTLEPLLETAQTVMSLPPYSLTRSVGNAMLANLLAQNAALIPPGSGTPPPTPPSSPPPPIPGGLSGIFFSPPFILLGGTLGFVGLVALIAAIVFGNAPYSPDITATSNPTFAPASVIAFTNPVTAIPTVGVSPISASTLTPAPSATSAPSLTPAPSPTTALTPTPAPTDEPATTLPPIDTVVEIEGTITFINVINNLTVVVINDTEFVLNPDVVQAFGPRLSIGLVLKFKTKRIENGQFIIISIVAINSIIITPPFTSQPPTSQPPSTQPPAKTAPPPAPTPQPPAKTTPPPPPKTGGGDDDDDKEKPKTEKPKTDKPDDKGKGGGKDKKK